MLDSCYTSIFHRTRLGDGRWGGAAWMTAISSVRNKRGFGTFRADSRKLSDKARLHSDLHSASVKKTVGLAECSNCYGIARSRRAARVFSEMPEMLCSEQRSGSRVGTARCGTWRNATRW